MEILKHGKYIEKNTCSNCDCIFNSVATDFKEEYFKSKYGDGNITYYFGTLRCPECNHIISIKDINGKQLNPGLFYSYKKGDCN